MMITCKTLLVSVTVKGRVSAHIISSLRELPTSVRADETKASNNENVLMRSMDSIF